MDDDIRRLRALRGERRDRDRGGEPTATRQLGVATSSLRAEEVENQRAHAIGLLLLDPMSSALHEMHAGHVRARGLLHPLERAGILGTRPSRSSPR